MKASELRIGNYVKDRGGKVIRIDFFEHLEKGYNCKFGMNNQENWHPFTEYTDYAEPIPLTEEWLLKLGWIFNIYADCYERYPNGDARMFLTYKEVNNSFDMFNYVLKATICKNIYYVHQLQNLYFALTGEELSIKD